MAERKLPSCSCPQQCAEVAPSDQTLIGFFSAVTHLSSGLYFSASIRDSVSMCVCVQVGAGWRLLFMLGLGGAVEEGGSGATVKD